MRRIFQTKRYTPNANSGQVMLITTLVLSGTILASVTIAGLLMIYQIRQAGNAIQFTRASFAADAGFEHQLYRYARGLDPSDSLDACNYPSPIFSTQPRPEFSAQMTPVGAEDIRISARASSGDANYSLGFFFGDGRARAVCLASAPE